ncbi:MAG: hypothetical protein ACXW2U_07905 [Telluria sp.]
MKAQLAIVLLGAGAWYAGQAYAATPEAKLAFNEAKDRAALEYKTARARCDLITGNPKDVCVAEAKAARVHADEEAQARYKNTLKAYTSARLRIASAYYDVDRAKCGAMTGNDKDICLQQAKATLVAAEADARADRKTIEARNDARDDKRTAEYKVALERCDAFAGAAKDSCVASAKAQYGK